MKHKETQYRNELMFLKSALSFDNPFNSTQEILQWMETRNAEIQVDVQQIAFREMSDWYFDDDYCRLRHKSGGFFSIVGVNVKTNSGKIQNWDQPIINQPEIGLLGIITKEIDGKLFFLMQAKIEPGNVNCVQLSPTLQATKSNYTQVHQGRKPRYLEFFTNRGKNEILLDQLQSEQGARFLKKRNRNIIIKVEENISIHDDFRWLTLGQIHELLKYDNVVNMDTRTVVSGISFGNHSTKIIEFYNLMNSDVGSIGSMLLTSAINSELSLYSFDDIIQWFTNLKAQYELEIKEIPLRNVTRWLLNDYSMKNEENKYFEVIAVNVIIENREIASWQQPLVKPVEDGICAFIVKKIDNVLHFLVQAKLEPGNFDILEMAPTIQCITGNYKNDVSRSTLPYLDYILSVNKENILFDTLQSEEGGRFFREQNRNLIVLADDSFSIQSPPNYIWMTLNQIKTFIKFNNFMNIQARSLIAAISFNA